MASGKPELRTVGKPERRVDSVKLATGRGTFVDDIAMPGLLHARILHSPLDPERAMARGAPVIHDEPDATGIKDALRNLAAEITAGVGDVARGFAEAEQVFEQTYRVPYVQQCSIEPHVTITWLDEDN